MHLDTPTINLATVLMVILECGILTALWAIHRDIKGVGYWAAGALAIAIGALGIYLRNTIPPALSIFMANMAILTGYVLTWWGIDRFFSREPYYQTGLLLLALSSPVFLYFGLADTDTRARLILLLSLLALLNGLRAHSMLRDIQQRTRFSQFFAGGTITLQVVCNLLLLVAILRSPPVAQPLAQTPASAWVFLVLLVLSVATVFAAVLLVNQSLQARLLDAAQHDPLTGALRRHTLEDAAEREIARSLRHHQPLSMLIFDLDHFKAINDRYGHPAGDEALRCFSRIVRTCLRREDLFSRTGGEEFCALLPDTDLTGAAVVAERIRATVDAGAVDFDGQSLRLTVSIGIAGLSDRAGSWSAMVRAADAALYRAKGEGRNRIVVADNGHDNAVRPINC